MKRKDDLFEGLDEFDEEIPDGKRFKMSDDDLGMSVEHALGAPPGEDSMHRPSGTLQMASLASSTGSMMLLKTKANTFIL